MVQFISYIAHINLNIISIVSRILAGQATVLSVGPVVQHVPDDECCKKRMIRPRDQRAGYRSTYGGRHGTHWTGIDGKGSGRRSG